VPSGVFCQYCISGRIAVSSPEKLFTGGRGWVG
jgi:hypothetical protein